MLNIFVTWKLDSESHESRRTKIVRRLMMRGAGYKCVDQIFNQKAVVSWYHFLEEFPRFCPNLAKFLCPICQKEGIRQLDNRHYGA